jgi:hypothetical protein
VTARTALSYWHLSRARFAHSAPFQNIRLAANKQSSTDPDETAIAIILTMLPNAVESAIRNPLTTATAWLALLPLDFDRFFAAIYFTVEEVEVADL